MVRVVRSPTDEAAVDLNVSEALSEQEPVAVVAVNRSRPTVVVDVYSASTLPLLPFVHVPLTSIRNFPFRPVGRFAVVPLRAAASMVPDATTGFTRYTHTLYGLVPMK